MWIVQYKAENESQPWVILKSYDNKTSACFNASRASSEYYMIKVTEPEGTVVWSK